MFSSWSDVIKWPLPTFACYQTGSRVEKKLLSIIVDPLLSVWKKVLLAIKLDAGLEKFGVMATCQYRSGVSHFSFVPQH